MRVAVLALALGAAAALGRPPVFGARREPPLETLRKCKSAKDVKRAETAWRRSWEGGPPPARRECDLALRALGSIRAAGRVRALLRALDGAARRENCAAGYGSSAAVASLALAGDAAAARDRLAAAARPDAVALGLAGTRERARERGAASLADAFDSRDAPCKLLFAAQRTGVVDFHGVDAVVARAALDILLDDVDGLLPGGDDLLLVTGRGAHSRVLGVSTVKEVVHARLAERGAPFATVNDGALLLRRQNPG